MTTQNAKIHRSEYTIDDFKQMKQVDHIYQICDTYLGSDSKEERYVYIYDINKDDKDSSGHVVLYETTFPQACEQLFKELIANAVDNVIRSHFAMNNIGKIEINLSHDRITVKNGGNALPLELTKDDQGNYTDIYLPQNIFGSLLFSSNYDKTKLRVNSGRNGYGVKLLNIFSKLFEIYITNAKQNLCYKQKWSNNMKEITKPIIKDCKDKDSTVEVSYVMDFKRFGYDQYPDEALALFYRHCVDAAFTVKVPVHISIDNVLHKKFNPLTLKQYTKLVFGNEKANSAIYFQVFPDSTEDAEGNIIKVELKGKDGSMTANTLPIFELAIIDTPKEGGDGKHIAFANGTHTFNGGVHVKAAIKAISPYIIDKANSILGLDKEDKKKSDKKTKIKFNVNDIEKHITIILSVFVLDAKFDHQIKSALTSPQVKFDIPDSQQFDKIKRWKLMEMLQETAENQMMKKLKATDGKRKRFVQIDKGLDAYLAGRSTPHKRILFGIEGTSASNYVRALIQCLQEPQAAGYIEFRGKPLNVLRAKFDKLVANAEFNKLKEMLGLREGVDYKDPANRKTLRYDEFIILADADHDGKHILMLILVFFNTRFPSLLETEFVSFMRTPAIRVYHKDSMIPFYTTKQFEAFRIGDNSETKIDNESKIIKPKNFSTKYCKGLGSSDVNDVKDDAENNGFYNVILESKDDEDNGRVNMIFGKGNVESRRKWLEGKIGGNEEELNAIVEGDKIRIKDFIDQEYVEYPRLTIRRGIPGPDGLKDVQRKILYTVFKFFKNKSAKTNINEDDIDTGKIITTKNKIKVGHLATHVSSTTCYHHGEGSLEKAIVSLSQDFVGACLMPFFTAKSMLGTRADNGDDAASPRYTFIQPAWWLNHVYKLSDFDLTGFKVTEDEPTEFKFALPIVPTHVINGVSGIASAYSTDIMSYHPLDVIDWLQAYLQSNRLPDILPHFEGFKGKSYIKLGTTNTPKTLITHGSFTVEEKYKRNGELKAINVTISELPIGLSGFRYKKFLDELREQKKLHDYRPLNTIDMCSYYLEGLDPSIPRTIRGLRLQKSYGLTNMYVLDQNGVPQHHKTIRDVMKTFADWRVKYYGLRKDKILANYADKLKAIEDVNDILEAVLNKKLIIFEEDGKKLKFLERKTIKERLETLKLSVSAYASIKLDMWNIETYNSNKLDASKIAKRITSLRDKDIREIWFDELENLKIVYLKTKSDTRKVNPTSYMDKDYDIIMQEEELNNINQISNENEGDESEMNEVNKTE